MAGSEFTVNNEVAGFQLSPQVTQLANGRLLFTWESQDPDVDGDGYGISARIGTVNSSGAITWDGGEFTVNTDVTDSQYDPQVTQLTSGQLLFTWTSDDPDVDGSNSGISARIGSLDASGAISWAGGEFTVNNEVTFFQQSSQVTLLANGQVLFTWRSQDPDVDGSERGISARIGSLDGSGGITWSGNEFTVNTEGANGQFFPQVTQLADGQLLFTWMGFGVDGDSSGISARLLTLGDEGYLEDQDIPLTIDVALADMDGSETLGDLLIDGLPAGALLSAGTDNGDGSWTLTPAQLAGLILTPPLNYNGDFILTVTATATETANSDTASTTIELPITVLPVNDLPVITSSATATIDENTTAVITVTATDPEGDVPTFSITGGDDGALFNIDANSGALTFIMGPDFETPGDVDADNIYDVEVTADDGNGGLTAQTLAITVNGVNEAPTFNVGDGIVTTAIGASDEGGRSITVQADGKILVAGYSHNGSNNDFALTRYNVDGSLDLSFDSDGIATTDFSASTDIGYSVAVQADGKILVAGTSHNGSDNDFALVRYNEDGSLDLSFDGDGIATTAIGASHDSGRSVTVQADGKILVAGFSHNGSDFDFALVRYNDDGSLDTGFDSDGIATTNFGPSGDFGLSVTVQADGKILVAGNNFTGSDTDFALVRYNTDGSLDLSFDSDGTLTTSIGASHDIGRSVTVQSDGKILVAGTSDNGSNDDFALMRYNTDGSLDLSFDSDGIATTDFGASDDTGQSVTVQADGKILVAGASTNGSNTDFALARYNTDGSLDLSFDNDGILTTDFGVSDDTGYGIAVQADGKILVIGESHNGINQDFALARYNVDGSLDLSFNSQTTLGGSVAFDENGAAVVLDGDVTIFDAELSSADNFDGATLSLSRAFASNSDDIFAASGPLAPLITGGDLTINSTIIGMVAQNANGNLLLTFNTNATNALVNDAMRLITYANSSDNPPASADIQWTFFEANNSGALSDIGTSTVNIAVSNDVPVITSSTTANLDENTTAVITVTATDPEGDTPTFSITGGDDEALFEIDANSGELTFITPPDFENPSDVGADNIYDVEVTAEDGNGGLAAQNLAITVNGVNEAPSFATTGDGIVTTDVGGSSDVGQSITVQADGKILVAGYSYNGSSYDFALVRYNGDGSLDTGFDGDGRLTTAIGTSEAYGESVTVQTDGKILVAGYSYNGSSYDFALVRYNMDGSLDTNFDGDGRLTTAIGTSEAYGESVTVQADGKILVAGYSSNGSSYDFALVRYNMDGSLDTNFDGDGRLTTAIGTSGAYSESVTVQADGKILVAGYSYNGNNLDFALVRYEANGSLDLSFDSDGRLTTDFGGPQDVGHSVTVQADGKILVAGYSWNSGNIDFALVRYNVDGSLDTGFDDDGRLTTDIGGSTDRGYSVTVQADGKILVAGQSGGEFALVRYNEDGSLDTSFDGDGMLTTDIGGSGDAGQSVTVQADGKILVAGYSNYSGDTDFALVRYNSDGSLDQTFDAANSFGSTVAYTEDGAAVVLEADVVIFDPELSSADNFDGAFVTLSRDLGASAEDEFGASGNLLALLEGGALVLSGTTIGTVTQNTGGTLILTFNANATNAFVDETLRSITYANSSDTPPTSVDIDWAFSDGNTGAQGSGSALVANGTSTINIAVSNDAPVITSSTTANLDENTNAVITVTATDPEGDVPTFSITGGADELLFAINSASGAVSFLAAPDFETPGSAAGTNSYNRSHRLGWQWRIGCADAHHHRRWRQRRPRHQQFSNGQP